MRRSDHPSRPSAITCCRFSALKTLPIPAAGVQPTAQVNISAPGAALAGFQVSINGRFWVSTEGLFGEELTKAAVADQARAVQTLREHQTLGIRRSSGLLTGIAGSNVTPV